MGGREGNGSHHLFKWSLASRPRLVFLALERQRQREAGGFHKAQGHQGYPVKLRLNEPETSKKSRQMD